MNSSVSDFFQEQREDVLRPTGVKTLSTRLEEITFTGCEDHRHSPQIGPHKAQENRDGSGYSFAMGDCQLIGKDGRIVTIHRLHAASMSQFLSTALLNMNFSESEDKVIIFPLFTAKDIVDVLEMSNWVVSQWLENHVIPDLTNLQLSCVFNLFPIAAFFQLDLLMKALGRFIDRRISTERLVETYRFAQVTDAALAARLWRRILTDFVSIYENDTYLSLTEDEIMKCFSDDKLNVKAAQDQSILESYKKNKRSVENNNTTSKIESYLKTEKIGDLGTRAHARIPHQVILAQAGWGDNGPTRRVEVYDYHRNEWYFPANRTLNEDQRAYHGLVATERGLLCMGGFNGRSYYRSASRYDFDTMEWKAVCSTVEPRCYVSLAQLDDNHIISCGGYTGQSRLRTAEIYDFEQNQWVRAGAMNVVRSDSRALSFPWLNRVYMLGGFDGRNCHRTFEYYCPQRDQWIQEQRLMASKRSGVGAVALSEHVILAMGGFNGTERLASSEMFDTREGTWQSMPTMNLSRSNFGCTVLEGEPWVVGGYHGDRTVDACERFDIRLQRWIEAPKMSNSRSALACTVVDNVDWIEKILDRGPHPSNGFPETAPSEDTDD